MKEIKKENQSDGLTTAAQAGVQSSQNLKDGEESHAMLLALVNSPLITLINRQQVKIIGSCLNVHGKRCVMVMFLDAEVKNGLLAVSK